MNLSTPSRREEYLRGLGRIPEPTAEPSLEERIATAYQSRIDAWIESDDEECNEREKYADKLRARRKERNK